MVEPEKAKNSLIPLEDFKALMGIDDRDNKTAYFCLISSTSSIEQYCKRKFLRKQYFEIIQLNNQLNVYLQEYPVSEILTVYTFNKSQFILGNGQLLEPEFYCTTDENNFNLEIPFELLLSSSLKPYQVKAIKVIYTAGYSLTNIPQDLQAACLELAAWNFYRYKSKRIGMTGNIKGSGIQGEHFESLMPENVRQLIEPYKRKTI